MRSEAASTADLSRGWAMSPFCSMGHVTLHASNVRGLQCVIQHMQVPCTGAGLSQIASPGTWYDARDCTKR